MANLNQIKVDDTTYDIEDNATRTASRVVVTDSDGKLSVSDVTTTELSLLDGKTSDNVRKITCSTSEPTSSQGSDGDVWIVYEA